MEEYLYSQTHSSQFNNRSKFGKRISLDVAKEGMRLRDFAARCGMTQPTLSEVLNGIDLPAQRVFIILRTVAQVKGLSRKEIKERQNLLKEEMKPLAWKKVDRMLDKWFDNPDMPAEFEQDAQAVRKTLHRIERLIQTEEDKKLACEENIQVLQAEKQRLERLLEGGTFNN